MIDKTKLRFLVADDSSTMRRIIIASLGKYGYTSSAEAADGNEAFEKCKTATFDCILTDWNMPNCDGLTFVQKLRQFPAYAKTPVIMITTEQSKEDVVEAMTHGINAYVVKPFSPDILKAKIEQLIPHG